MKLRLKLGHLTLALTCAAVALASTATAAPAAPAPPTPDRAKAAAGWVARQLVDGDHFEVTFGDQSFPDQGLTIDAIFAFASAGVARTAGGNAAAWLARPEILSAYIGDGGTESYVGGTAKATLAAEVRGLDPTSFGGVDLPARLRALLAPSGRFSDRSAFGDFSNAFTQSLAIIALHRTPGGVPSSAVDFAAGTQCADGGFPVFFDVAPCVSDTDATALVAQALLATGHWVDAQEGLSWLASVQQADGGLSAQAGDASTPPNANTTGLAGQAFRTGGRLLAAARARAFLVHLQVGCSGAAADRGAIAFDASGFDPATAQRSTPQAILGLGGPDLATLTATGSAPTEPVLLCHP
jgi:hypothetical protein